HLSLVRHRSLARMNVRTSTLNPANTPLNSRRLCRRESRRVQPKHGLSYEEIPNHFLDRRVRGQTLPELQVFGATEGEAREQETALAHRPLAVVHHVGPERPTLLVANERHNELQSLANPATVGQLERPEFIFRRREYLADGRQRFEVEERVAVRLRAPQLLWEAPVRRKLVRHEHGLEALAAVVEQLDALRGQVRQSVARQKRLPRQAFERRPRARLLDGKRRAHRSEEHT